MSDKENIQQPDLGQNVELSDEQLDEHINAVLRSSGTKVANYTLHESRDNMRKAMRGIIATYSQPPAAAPAIDRAAIHRKVLAQGMNGPDVIGPTVCTVPPPGWSCTRAPGHDGPCAAVPASAPALQPNRIPSTPEEIIAFIGPHFDSLMDRAENKVDFRYELSVHDLLAAFSAWKEMDSSIQVQEGVAREVFIIPHISSRGDRFILESDAIAAPANQVAAVPEGWRDDLDLIRACIEGYPAAPARNTALATIRKLLAAAASPAQPAPCPVSAWKGPFPLQIDSYMTDREGVSSHVIGKEIRLEYTDGADCWKLALLLPSAQAQPAPEADGAAGEREFVVKDGDLQALLDAAVNYIKGGPQNMDTVLHMHSLFERVEARLATQPPADAAPVDAKPAQLSVLEWDRPKKGLYADGSIRMITSRMPDGSVGACHTASPDEIRWVLLMEAQEDYQQGRAAGIEEAAKYLDGLAERYIQEHAETEPDTGAIVWEFGDAGRDYHSTLTEEAAAIRKLGEKL